MRGLGIRMLTLDTKTSLYTEDRCSKYRWSDRIVGTQFCDTVPLLVRPDPRIRERIYTSLDTFRSRRMDHTPERRTNTCPLSGPSG